MHNPLGETAGGGGWRESDDGLLLFIGGVFIQTNGDGERINLGRGEDAFDLIEIAAGIDREALGLGDKDSAGIPGIVGEFEDRTHRAVGQDTGGLVIATHIQAGAVPDAQTAAAAGGGDTIHVHALALVLVVVVVAFVIPAIDDGVADPLAPEIETAGNEHLFAAARGGRGGKRRTVGAMGDAVVFPGEIIQAFGHGTGESLDRKRR